MFINLGKGTPGASNSALSKTSATGSEALARRRGAKIFEKLRIAEHSEKSADSVTISAAQNKSDGRSTYSAGKNNSYTGKIDTFDGRPINMFSLNKVADDSVSDFQIALANAFSPYTGVGGASQRLDEIDTSAYNDWFLEYASGDKFFKNHAKYRMGELTGTGDYRIHTRFHGSSLMVETVEGDERKVFLVDANRVNAQDASLVEAFAALADHIGKNKNAPEDDKDLFLLTVALGEVIHPTEHFRTGGWKRSERFDLETTRINFIGRDEVEAAVLDDSAFDNAFGFKVPPVPAAIVNQEESLEDVRASAAGEFIARAKNSKHDMENLLKLYESFEKIGDDEGVEGKGRAFQLSSSKRMDVSA